jgi:GH15 family glucan-1,4-alpha-glucosidase
MREGIHRHFWLEERGHFARMLTVKDDGGLEPDPTLDASAMGVWAFGGLPPDDPQVEATMRAVGERLTVKTAVGGVARYEGDPYHATEPASAAVPGNPWIICEVWMARYRIATARTRDDLAEAMGILERVAARALPSGVLPEQVHPRTGGPVSVSPLTWSHAEMVAAVVEFLERGDAIAGGPTAAG